MKFGGSSVADAEAIDRVSSIVKGERARAAHPVVVVSALGGVTDALLTAAEAARSGRTGILQELLESLATRHLKEARKIAPEDSALSQALTRHLDELREVLSGAAARGCLEPSEADAVAATGELLSSRILAAAMSHRGLPAVWIDARDAVITDAGHTRAMPLLEETTRASTAAILPIIETGGIPVLGGFVGRTVDGATTTLGRGGSDYSASLIGAALGASEIQIWTDVDGMLTADPRIVADAEVVRHLSFAEAAELAYFGAKVLHPSTIFPAVSRDIPVRILNSHRPDGTGTLITAQPPRSDRPFAALACKRG